MLKARALTTALMAVLTIVCVWGIFDTARDLQETIARMHVTTTTTTIARTITSMTTTHGVLVSTHNDTKWLPEKKGDIVCVWTHYAFSLHATKCSNPFDEKLVVSIYGEIVSLKNASGLSRDCNGDVTLRFEDDQPFFCHDSNRSVFDKLDEYWPIDDAFSCSVDSSCRFMRWYFAPDSPTTTTLETISGGEGGGGDNDKSIPGLIALLVVLCFATVALVAAMIYCACKAKQEYDLDRGLRRQLYDAERI